ncbi:MAG TPA: SDR family oxidoreductase [Roseiflexaceae bacterium]|nr:SDR family oxidoreductase [Roseiflexaceae bacterium]
MPIEGKVVLITGGGSGVGAAIARQFAEAGAQVVVMGRRAEQLQATCESIVNGPQARPIVADVADRAQVSALVEQVVSEFGRLDILVNNAGVNTPARRLEQLSFEDWDYLMTVNATGAFNVIQAVLPHMRSRGDGLIINVSSISGRRASTLAGAAYSASKHALNALSKVVSQEEEQHGIRSTIISPGDINTPLLDKRPAPVSAEQRAKILQPDDIAAAALFVARLPAHVSVPEIVIKPIGQMYS